MRVNGRDVTDEIRSQRISGNVSTVAVIPACRENLVARQRAIIEAAPNGIVAEGRDITTVVAPDADVRLLLSADPEIRMARRKLDHGGQIDDGGRFGAAVTAVENEFEVVVEPVISPGPVQV